MAWRSWNGCNMHPTQLVDFHTDVMPWKMKTFFVSLSVNSVSVA